MSTDKVIENIFIGIAFITIVYGIIFLGTHVKNEVICLEKGYPVTRTTFNLKGYCITLDGGTYGKVTPVDAKQ